MATISITSNEGALNSPSAVLEVSATNPEYNQPALRVRQESILGAAASIRIDDPNPDIEFVETKLNQGDPAAGKYEIAVQSDKLQINGRNSTNSRFEVIAIFQRRAAGGNVGIGFPQARDYEDFAGGQGVIVIANASVAPSPAEKFANAGVLFVESGALKYMGSNGTVTEIAPA